MVVRVGFDIGGSKLAAIALDAEGRELDRAVQPVPGDYGAMLGALAGVVGRFVGFQGAAATIGIGLPGLIDRRGELVRLVNLPWLEGRPLIADLERATGHPVTIANDANCFALSEATDGAAAGVPLVFAAILGTGVGGAIALNGRPLTGANGIGGEWGHSPLAGEDGAPPCACGRRGCVEAWLNGAALAREYEALSGQAATAEKIARLAEQEDRHAHEALARYRRRLARALAAVINLLDPDVIVLGGGLSRIESLYRTVPAAWSTLTVAPARRTRLLAAAHGAESGLRGAAWLGGPATLPAAIPRTPLALPEDAGSSDRAPGP